MTGGSAERDQQIRDLSEKLQLIHAKYMAHLGELRSRQAQLLKAVMERIDREQAQEILTSIKEGGTDTK